MSFFSLLHATTFFMHAAPAKLAEYGISALKELTFECNLSSIFTAKYCFWVLDIYFLNCNAPFQASSLPFGP